MPRKKLTKLKRGCVWVLTLLFLLLNTPPVLAATFTAGMAKRDAPGPFAAGILPQSKWLLAGGDFVSAGVGTTISGSNPNAFYSNWDNSQGSVVFWFTPEFDGNDNTKHRILQLGGIWFEKNEGNQLRWQSPAGSMTISGSSIVAGTTYKIVLRWDRNNTLDGTRYASISLNDTHTFGVTSVSPQNPSVIGIGIASAVAGANAIVEGLTIYRRPLFDGTYGIDVGNGDEINQIYNSGTGKDPTLVTGSWDVVFALPTNSSTGTLATGTGEAWTHPHLSNLLYTSTTNTGGFMMNGTYTSDGWSDEGTPSSVAALATSEKLFAGGYKVTSDAANEGIYYDKTVTAGNDWVIRALGNSDGTCSPRVILYDQTNTAEIGHLDGTTTSTRADPDVYIFTGEAPSGMTSLRVKLVNTATSGTCYWHQVEVLSNMVNNPSYEGVVADPYIPTGWTNSGLDAGDSSYDTSDKNSGGGSFSYTANNPGCSWEGMAQSLTTTSDKFYSGGLMYKKVGTAPTNNYIGPVYDGNTIGIPFTLTSTSWTSLKGTWRRPPNLSTVIFRTGSQCPASFKADDAYHFLLTDVSLTVTPASEANSTENTDEIRVDGRDTYVQTGGGSLKTGAGYMSLNWRPRHSAADASKFAEDTTDDAYIFALTDSDNSDYVNLYWDSANTMKLEYAMNGSTGSGTWDATSAISANTEYTLLLTYTGSSTMTLAVDGTNRITLSSIPSAFAEAPDDVYLGSSYSGTKQGDATFSNLTFDTAAPSVSLTAYTPDPTTTTVPTLTGTATDALTTVSAVQFQVDSTAGSWSSCTADDGSFDEASETFSCTTDSLADGAHTVYVRATDNVSNTTSSGSEASDSFTVDTTGPLSLTLDSPGSGAILTTRSPVFRFKGTTDGTTSITKYEVVVDFGTGSAVNLVGDIAPSGTDVDTSDTYINYDLDYIEVQSKLATNELSEGPHTWRVTAYDTLGNYTYSQRSFAIDFSPPALENLTLADSTGIDSAGYHVLTATKPKITGVATDANYPESVVVTFYQQALAGNVLISESLYLTQTLSLANQTGIRIPFEFYTSKDLPLGKYRIEVKVADKAGNSTQKSFHAQITSDSLLANLLYLPVTGSPFDKLDVGDGFSQETDTVDTKVSVPQLQQAVKQVGQEQTNKLVAFFGKIGNYLQDRLYALGQTKLANFTRKVRYALSNALADIFGGQPTQITNVELAEVGSTFAVITWETNTYTINNKVNMGEDLTYSLEAFGANYTKKHEVRLDNLKPDTKYYFEVMSQGKNYAYDANRAFVTPKN